MSALVVASGLGVVACGALLGLGLFTACCRSSASVASDMVRAARRYFTMHAAAPCPGSSIFASYSAAQRSIENLGVASVLHDARSL